MRIKLDDMYQKAVIEGKRIFGFSFELPDISPVELYESVDENERFYFETPEGEWMIGSEYLTVYQGKTPEEIEEIKQQLADELIAPEETDVRLFGGFAFDPMTPCPKEWGTLGTGIFVLPQFLFIKENSTRLVITIEAGSLSELAVSINRAFEQAQQWFKKSLQKSTAKSTRPLVLDLKEEEVEEWLTVVDQTVSELKKPHQSLRKVVLSRTALLQTNTPFKFPLIIDQLRRQQENVFVFALEYLGYTFLGATPERLLKASETTFTTVGLAGTAPRGNSLEEDEQLADDLLQDPKNSEEHQIVADRVEQELRAFIQGNVAVSQRKILKNRDLQHLVASFTGKRKEYPFLAAVAALHPTPALGGEPRNEAMTWIRENERKGRGLYGAPIGWVSLQKDIGEFIVGIRSGVFTKETGLLYAGCGIVDQSVAEDERQETWLKFQPMIRGVQGE